MAFEKMVVIRSYDDSDKAEVEDLERRCEANPADEGPFLLTDTMGDPICRIRNSPSYNMLVAEVEGRLVGVIRGTIKMVTVHPGDPTRPHQRNVGYILGLRVSPSHRRKGIATELVQQLERWFASHAVDYAYMATEKDNTPSLRLFTEKLRFYKFRTPSILVDPVRRRPVRMSSRVRISKLTVTDAEALYRSFMAGSADFFPQDIDSILQNKLSLGTWAAYYDDHHDRPSVFVDGGSSSDEKYCCCFEADGGGCRGRLLPSSWAMMSVWNCGEVFKLRMGKVPWKWRAFAKGAKWVECALPCFKGPVVPDVFDDAFGFYFVYGVHGEGELSNQLVRSLWTFVGNMACRSNMTNNSSSRGRSSKKKSPSKTSSTSSVNIKVMATEVGGWGAQGLTLHIPHTKWLSCPEDLWCIKPLQNTSDGNNDGELMSNNLGPPRRFLFVDPREV